MSTPELAIVASEANEFRDLFVLLAVAVVAPLLTLLARRIRISAVVLEILLGILVGPQVLGLVTMDAVIESFAAFGLAMLFFLAGYEIDPRRLGRPIRRAGAAWAGGFAVALGVAGVLAVSGVVIDSLVVGLALTTTALGALLPILRDQGEMTTPFGERVIANGAVGEFAPIVAIALLFAGGSPLDEGLLLIGFFVSIGVVLVLIRRVEVPWIHLVLRRGLRSSSQLPIRLCLLLVALLVWIAASFGLDMLLGAFAAGVVVRFAVVGDGRGGDDAELFGEKLEGIGFGIFIPIFFVSTGVAFDLDALFDSVSTVLKVPLFLGLMLLARAVPVFLAHRGIMSRDDRVALALYSATALPLVVAITTIGVDLGRMRTDNATALVAAAMLSVLILPVLAGQLRARSAGRDDTEPASVG